MRRSGPGRVMYRRKSLERNVCLCGHCRVGLEDNLFLEKGQLAKSNAEQVAKMARIIRELGSEPATPDEARQILGLKGLNRVNF